MVAKLLKYWLTLLLLTNLLFTANSQTKPAKIWASVHFNKKEVMVGEPLVVTMTVYTSTWFTNPPDFDEIQVPKSIMVKLEQRTGSLMKTIGGQNYPAIEQKFVVYPIEVGENMLPPLNIVTECPPEGDYKGRKRTIKTPQRKFTVLPPPKDIEIDKWLTAYNVQLSETWDKPFKNLKTGDILERRINIRASGALAALIPPIEEPEVDFGTVYQKQPILSNFQNKASFSGRRVEITTFLIEKAGTFMIPEVTFSWFNPRTKKIEQKTLPQKELVVAENPNLEFVLSMQDSLRALLAEQEIVEEIVDPFEFMGFNWWQLLIVVLSGLILIYLIFRGIMKVLNWRKKRLVQIAESEEKYFNDLRQMTKTDDKNGVMRSLMFWFDRFRKGKYDPTFESFLKEQGDEKLKSETEALEKHVFGKEDKNQEWSADKFYQDLSIARKKSLKREEKVEDIKKELPSLNP